MPFVGNFTISQDLDATGCIIVDAHTGSDATITGRRLYLKKWDGTYLTLADSTTDYILWDIGVSQLIITDLFDKDYAFEARVEWITPTPDDAGVYTLTKTVNFSSFLEQFDYGLTQLMAANPNIVRDTTFFSYKMKLRVYIDSSNNAVKEASDIYNAQYNLNKGTELLRDANIYF